MSIRVMLVDDHPLFRQAVYLLLARHPDIEIVGEAQDGIVAIKRATEVKPDVLVLDLSMPHLDGLGVARKLSVQMPEMHILVLSGRGDAKNISAAMSIGVAGYVIKESASEDLVEGIYNVMAGNRFLSHRVAETLLTTYQRC